MTTVEKITKILVDYTKKNHIMASVAILEAYAEELVKNGVTLGNIAICVGEKADTIKDKEATK